MSDSDVRIWRQSPFVVGCRYRVRCDFAALRDNFLVGEVLTFTRDAYSRYDSYTGYFFSQAGSENVRVWDIHDDGDLEIWRSLFEEIPREGTQAG